MSLTELSHLAIVPRRCKEEQMSRVAPPCKDSPATTMYFAAVELGVGVAPME